MVAAVERHVTGEQLVEGDAERINVGAMIGELRRLHLLGGDVFARAQEGAAHRVRRAFEHLRDAEVDDLGLEAPLRVDHQDVVGLEVAMDDAVPMRLVHRAENAAENGADLLERHATAPLRKMTREAGPFDVLHDDGEEVVELDEVVDGDDAGVSMRAQHA